VAVFSGKKNADAVAHCDEYAATTTTCDNECVTPTTPCDDECAACVSACIDKCAAMSATALPTSTPSNTGSSSTSGGDSNSGSGTRTGPDPTRNTISDTNTKNQRWDIVQECTGCEDGADFVAFCWCYIVCLIDFVSNCIHSCIVSIRPCTITCFQACIATRRSTPSCKHVPFYLSQVLLD
jgi:hypothetical protein